MHAIVWVWMISYFFANLFTCYPITPFVEPFYGHKCVDAVPMWLSAIVSDIVLDFIIFAMPIPMVFRLQLPTKQKFGVCAILLLGAW